MPFPGYFYPRITYGSVSLDTTWPASVVVGSEIPVAGVNVALSGARETLHVRTETRVAIRYGRLTKAELAAFRTWYVTHAGLGKASTLVLDRFGTCTGQYEYDVYNTFFTLAELIGNPFEPQRIAAAVNEFSLSLLFRQGASA